MSKINKNILEEIKKYSKNPIKIMEVCGTHTMSIFEHGLRQMLPKNIELLSGPGCPVCVAPASYIDNAVEISKSSDNIVLTFGDMMKVPGTDVSLEKVKALGNDIRVVYSPLDCLKIAKENPTKKVVFLAVGFETTSPVIALAVKKAKEMKIDNFFILCGLKLIIPAIEMLCEHKDLKIDGFLLPGHVSAIIGQSCYEFLPQKYNKAFVITGFDSHEMLYGLNLLIQQIDSCEYKVENAYENVVEYNGNIKANQIMHEVFKTSDDLWRGIGKIKNSGLKLTQEYKDFDASNIIDLKQEYELSNNGCICGEVIKGTKKPYDCMHFNKSCSPLNPMGPCMVSSEGTCAAYYKYGRN